MVGNPDNPTVLANYASFLVVFREDLHGARELYEKALSIDPQHARLRL
jgi:hypothetical protein